ncbi:MAG: hypothetical protein GXX84_09260 [Acidobacteria bacterium]|nr:hypothetical protein [Acidobacteriota bacterium]
MRQSSALLAALMIGLAVMILPAGAARAEEPAAIFLGESVSAEQLEDQAGGQDTTIEKLYMMLNDVDIEGEVGDNVLFSSGTGNNYLSDSAFADSNGMNTVFQNTGNMNVLQSSYIINVTIGD